MFEVPHWQLRDWLLIGDRTCLKYVKSKFHGFEYLNLSLKENDWDNKKGSLLEAIKSIDATIQGKRKNRIYYSGKMNKKVRGRIGRSLGATGLIIMQGRTNLCEKFFSGEPFKYIFEVTYDYAQRKLTLNKLKGDSRHDDICSSR